jgi:hypothetical protein
LIAAAIAGVFIWYVVRDGFGVAVFFGVIASSAWIWIVRAKRRWNTLSRPGRVYAAAEGALLFALLAVFFFAAQFNPSLVRGRNARYLQRILNDDDRFADVRVQYLENKVKFLRVEGNLDSERNFQSLREMVARYDWNEVYWNVTVDSRRGAYDGWDSMLFGGKADDSH